MAKAKTYYVVMCTWNNQPLAVRESARDASQYVADRLCDSVETGIEDVRNAAAYVVKVSD